MFAFYRPTLIVTKGSGPEHRSCFVFSPEKHDRYPIRAAARGELPTAFVSADDKMCQLVRSRQLLVSLWNAGSGRSCVPQTKKKHQAARRSEERRVGKERKEGR